MKYKKVPHTKEPGNLGCQEKNTPKFKRNRIRRGYQVQRLRKCLKNIIEEIFSNLKYVPIKVQEVKRTTNRLDQKCKSSSHIIIKILNTQNKDRVSKTARGKSQVRYKGRTIRTIPVFSMETLKARYPKL